MKKRIAFVVLFIPLCIIDGLSLPIAIVNWIITGEILEPMSQRIQRLLFK